MIDISNKEILVQYLFDKGIIKKGKDYAIHYCTGGVSGTVAFVTVESNEMIVKQALSKLKVKEDWLCNPSRMYGEQLSNKIYHKIVPESVPAVLFYDQDNYIYGRVAAPAHCDMWKSDLMQGTLDFIVAKKAIEALVDVQNVCCTDVEVAQELCDKKVFYDLRISPYIEFTVQKHPELKEIGDYLIHELMEKSITLVHGDYSPKNIMLDKQKIFILDFEVAHYGNPVFDLAFFANHFVLKSLKFPKRRKAYLSLLSYMLDIYYSRMNFGDNRLITDTFVPLLGMLMLARVDGKSPVEYLVNEEEKKQQVRTIASVLMHSGIKNYTEAIDLIAYLEDEKRGV
jgi:hypothetical protein